MSDTAPPNAKTLTRVTHTTVTTTTVSLTEEDAAQILREHYSLPGAQVEFECRGGYLYSVEIEHVVSTETEEASNVAG